MHHPFAVRVLERIGDFAKDARRVGDRQLAKTNQPCAKILSRDERHCEVEQSAFRRGRKNRDDVRMLKLRGEQYLPAEAIGVESCREIRWKDFDHDLTVKLDFARQKHARHTSTAELALNVVAVAEDFLELR